LDRPILRDEQCERISPYIVGDDRTRGSPGQGNRIIVEAVLWIVRTGSPWRDLPDVLGDWNSVFRRFSCWSKKGDAPQAEPLIKGLPADIQLADTADDSARLGNLIAEKGAIAIIPNNPSRAKRYPLDEQLYAQRYLVECCFSRLKQFHRVATRFEKIARNHLAVVTIAALALWIR